MINTVTFAVHGGIKRLGVIAYRYNVTALEARFTDCTCRLGKKNNRCLRARSEHCRLWEGGDIHFLHGAI